MAQLKRFDQFINEGIEDNHESAQENYMFFGNLEQMKRQIEMLLEMDREKVDMVLQNGHNWAVDHIATSKDDIEEVFNFLKGEMDGSDESNSYSEEDLDQMSKDQMEHDEMMLRREQGI
jgi:hypothetical protein